MGAGSPVLASVTVSDFEKSSILSAGTDNLSTSPSTFAVRSK